MPNLTARQMLSRLPVRMAEGGAVDTAPGVSAAYRAAMERGGQQTVNDYYANLRKDAEAYLANPDAPRGVEAYNVLLQSGISTSDLINAGVGQAVLDKIFAVQAPIKQEQFITPAGMTSAYERSPDLAFESQRLTALGQDGRAILDKQGRDYIANLQQGGINATERAQMLEYATERGYSFDDLMKAGVDPNVLFTQPAAAAAPPMPGSALAPPVFPQTQPTYIPPTVYQPLPTQPDIFAAGQPALDVAFRESSPRTAILDDKGRPTGQFDYSPAAKLRPATGSGFTFTPPSVTSRPRSLLSPREIQAYGGMTSKSQQFAANRAAIDRSLRRLQAASPALSNPSAYALLRNRIMAQDFGDPQRVFDPKTGEVNLTTEEGQSFLKAVNALAAASPAEKAAAEKAATTSAPAGTGGTGSTTQAGGYAAAIDGGDKITYGGYDILQQAKGGLVKKSKGSAKDELARFANGGEARVGGSAPAVAGRTGRAAQLAAQRADEPQTESRAMLERLDAATPVERAVFESTGMEPGLDRAMMLPFAGSREEGNLQLAAPGFVYDAARAFVTPGMAARGQQVSDEDILNTAMNVMGGGAGASRVAGPRTAPDEVLLGMGVGSRDTPTAADDLAELTDRAPKLIDSLPGRNELNYWIDGGQDAVERGFPEEPFILLDKLYIDPQNRGQGAARQVLVEGLQEMAEQYPGMDVRLLAEPLDRSTNQSDLVRLYESVGFEVDNYQDGMSAIPMSLRLPKKVARTGGNTPTAADDLAALTAKAPTDTPEFKNWFGNSAITTSLEPNGKPRRLYHITPKNFDAFDVNRPDAVGPMSAESGPVIFMSDDPEKQPAAHNVGGFKGKFKEGANVMPVYASIQNPLFIDSTSEAAERARFNLGRNWPYLYTQEDVSKLQDAGYDGVFLTGQYGPNEIVAFRPEQVKSAIGNEGAFDPANPVITKAKGGAVSSAKHMLDNLIEKKPKSQRFANGGSVDAELLRRQLENIDNTPTARTPEREPTPEQTESRTMLERLGRFASLDTPQDMGLGETTADIGMGFLPVVGTAQGARDFERARRDEDKLGMLLSAASMIPVAGGAVRAVRSAGKASRAADDLAALTAQVPTDIPQPSAALDMPPLENAQRTQLGSSTIPSYAKAREILSSKNRILDFGAGRGQGASLIGADTFEPYPREGFNPSFSNVADIPSGSYDGLTSLNVLNVMPREVRDDAVRNIGRILADDGEAVITTRGRDVMTAKGVDGPEPMSRITTADTYQKGFTQKELTDYVSSVLGENFVVGSLPQKIGAAGVLVKKTKASNNTGSAAGEARQMLDAVTQAAMPRTPTIGMPVNFSGLRQAGVSPQELRQIDESFRTHQGAVQSVDELVSTAARVDPLFQESVLDVANSIGGTYVKGPLKTPESISEKLVRKGGSAAEVPDSVRATILVQNNEQAEEAIRQIAGRYPMIDEGWQRVPSNGYIDRKLAIQFTGPNGERLLGEIQINTPPMQTVKDTIGHTLYEVERRLIQQSGGVTQMSPEELMRYRSVVEQQSQVYGEAASRIDPSIIKQVTDKRARGGYIGRLGRL